MKAYTYLGWAAMILTPVGAVIFFGWRVYTAVNAETGTTWLAVPAGIAAAVGLEMVGIFAGHLSMELWQRRDGRAWLAAGIMAIYVAIGVIELMGTIGMVMFLIAPLVYVLVGLRQSVDVVVAEETAVAATRQRFNFEQAAKDAEISRQLKLKQQDDKTAVKLAQIEAKANQSQHSAGTEQIEPALERIKCDDCGQAFGSVQALNAHGRWCKAKEKAGTAVYVNGNGVGK